MRNALLLSVLMLIACQGGGALQLLEPRLEADTSQVDFPDAELGQEVETRVGFSNPGGGVTHFTAHLEPSSTTIVLTQATGSASHDEPGVLVLRHVGMTSGTETASLVVDHDGMAGDDGSKRLVVPVRAFTRPPPDCDDHNPCTLDLVDPALPGTCVHTPMNGACDDGNACTRLDRCVSGACVGQAIVCDDSVDCTVDGCDPQRGCVFEPLAQRCDDGDPCTTDACGAGGCVHSEMATGAVCGPVACDTVMLCVAGECVPTPTPDGYPCDDGNPCTSGDACRGGLCDPGPYSDGLLGPPVTAFDATNATDDQAGQLEGMWPVALDAVESLHAPDAEQSGFPLLALWRGVRTQTRVDCYADPASCSDASPSCPGAQPAPLRTELLLSSVEANGASRIVSRLDADAAYTIMAREGGDGVVDVPSHSVDNVAVTRVGGALWGAALIHYAAGCRDCTGSPISDGGGGPLRLCLAESHALAIFVVVGETLTLVDARQIPGTVAPAPRPLVTLRNHLPMLAISATTEHLNVVWGRQLCVDCQNASNGGSDQWLAQRETFTLMNNSILPPASGRDYNLLAPWPGVENNVDDFTLVDEGACLGWTQRAGSLPPPDSCTQGPELLDAWRACLDDAEPTAEVHVPRVKAVLPDTRLLEYRWMRSGQGDGVGMCAWEDVVTRDLANVTGTTFALPFDGENGLVSASVAMMWGYNVFLATDATGGAHALWEYGSPSGTLPTQHGFYPAHPLRASSWSAPIIAGLGRQPAPQAPTPVLVTMRWLCGAPPRAEP